MQEEVSDGFASMGYPARGVRVGGVTVARGFTRHKGFHQMVRFPHFLQLPLLQLRFRNPVHAHSYWLTLDWLPVVPQEAVPKAHHGPLLCRALAKWQPRGAVFLLHGAGEAWRNELDGSTWKHISVYCLWRSPSGSQELHEWQGLASHLVHGALWLSVGLHHELLVRLLSPHLRLSLLFTCQTSWLLGLAGIDLPAPKEHDDPNLATGNIISAAKKLGFAAPTYTPMKLTAGYGKEVSQCRLPGGSQLEHHAPKPE